MLLSCDLPKTLPLYMINPKQSDGSCDFFLAIGDVAINDPGLKPGGLGGSGKCWIQNCSADPRCMSQNIPKPDENRSVFARSLAFFYVW